jgi:hypothetical protein
MDGIRRLVLRVKSGLDREGMGNMGWLEPKPVPSWADIRKLEGQLEVILKMCDSHALDDFVRELFSKGFDEGEALGVLERFRRRLRTQDREADEDKVLDVMDRLVGWCSSHATLQRESDSTER